MASKITLYSDSDLIKEIKAYAKEHNTSVSKIVNDFFKNLLHHQPKEESSLTDELEGILKDTTLNSSSYKKYLQDKYL